MSQVSPGTTACTTTPPLRGCWLCLGDSPSPRVAAAGRALAARRSPTAARMAADLGVALDELGPSLTSAQLMATPFTDRKPARPERVERGAAGQLAPRRRQRPRHPRFAPGAHAGRTCALLVRHPSLLVAGHAQRSGWLASRAGPGGRVCQGVPRSADGHSRRACRSGARCCTGRRRGARRADCPARGTAPLPSSHSKPCGCSNARQRSGAARS